MQLHLMRHGIAIDHGDPACPAEPDRFLTEKGIERTWQACRGWATTGVNIDWIAASPYRRAQQTADIACEALGLQQARRIETASLLPGQHPAEILGEIEERAQSVLLVGHAPHLDRTLAYLLGSDRPVSRIKKAGVVSLLVGHWSKGGGQIEAFMPPSVLRALDRQGERG